MNSKERMGISRTVIKSYIESNYNMEITPSVVSNISRALKTGEDKNIFVFPKGMHCMVSVARAVQCLSDTSQALLARLNWRLKLRLRVTPRLPLLRRALRNLAPRRFVADTSITTQAASTMH